MVYEWLICAALGVFSVLYVWRKRKFSLFHDLNIPGPTPSLLFGNTREIRNKGTVECFTEWLSQHGDIVGYYNGSLPFLIVKDTELLKRILIKDFDNFQSRGVLSVYAKCSSNMRHNLLNTTPDRWKAMRNMITPVFTSGKMRQMSGLLQTCTDEFLEMIDRKEGDAFNIYDNFQRLTMDVIVKAAFGMQMEFQKGCRGQAQEYFLALARQSVRPSFHSILFVAMNCLAELAFFWKLFLALFGRFFAQSIDNMTESLDSIIELRRSKPDATRRDLLQAMLDVRVSNDDIIDVNKLTARYDVEQDSDGVSGPKTTGVKSRYMTNAEIRANATTFLLAGYETTSTALAFATYLLAKHQDVQDRLRDEITDTITSHGELNHDAVLGMKYMEQVFSESLRYYPPVIGFTTRTAANDFHHKDVTIPAGVAVLVPTYQLHHDPDLWHEPERFDPERFHPSNRTQLDSMTYQPFGSGPRNCVGMRFAQLEAKLTLAKMLSKYRVFLDDRYTQLPLQVSSTTVLMHPKDGVWVQLEKLKGK
ncbi:cytochrome P450 3A12-like isoform X2 [Ornithodoros turicata]|uniref:cytochrome P450 3A12-like isoform X2 n=1 Tax=Ornithodoros turicata TaxID=34597 RepID=UPI0031388E79